MIGIDICEVQRFDKLSKDDAFLQKVFTQNEIDYCKKSARASERFAARYAAKEAFAKAVGSGFGADVHFSDIEIIKNDAGAPEIKLYGATKDFFAAKFNQKHICLSISHEKSVAVAVVILME